VSAVLVRDAPAPIALPIARTAQPTNRLPPALQYAVNDAIEAAIAAGERKLAKEPIIPRAWRHWWGLRVQIVLVPGGFLQPDAALTAAEAVLDGARLPRGVEDMPDWLGRRDPDRLREAIRVIADQSNPLATRERLLRAAASLATTAHAGALVDLLPELGLAALHPTGSH
jgi:hypothetical protein